MVAHKGVVPRGQIVALLGSNGEPDPDNYFFDGLHLSKRGYSIWREIIRQRLLDELGDFPG